MYVCLCFFTGARRKSTKGGGGERERVVRVCVEWGGPEREKARKRKRESERARERT